MRVLITGSANGIGAAFVEAYSQQQDVNVISVDLQPLSPARLNIQHFMVDMASETSVQDFAKQLDGSIDLVIHSAGVRGLVPAEEDRHPDNVEACEILAVMDCQTLEKTFQINAVGTFSLLKSILPNLRLALRSKVVVMSSRMGSVGNNQAGNRAAGGGYAYRASKAALNAIVRSFAVDEPSITFVLCHPGRVESKLVRCKEAGAISAQESVQSMLPLIDSWHSRNSGKFYDRFGAPIEW